jgi:hypothetical protein
LEREGHEYLVDIDRSYIKDYKNHYGLKEKLISELNLKSSEMSEKQFKFYIRHLYKSGAPTKEDLVDEKYL